MLPALGRTARADLVRSPTALEQPGDAITEQSAWAAPQLQTRVTGNTDKEGAEDQGPGPVPRGWTPARNTRGFGPA